MHDTFTEINGMHQIQFKPMEPNAVSFSTFKLNTSTCISQKKVSIISGSAAINVNIMCSLMRKWHGAILFYTTS